MFRVLKKEKKKPQEVEIFGQKVYNHTGQSGSDSDSYMEDRDYGMDPTGNYDVDSSNDDIVFKISLFEQEMHLGLEDLYALVEPFSAKITSLMTIYGIDVDEEHIDRV